MNHRFLLIGWDAADWQFLSAMLDAGELPTLNQIVESGVISELELSQPTDLATQWTSILTGKRLWQHGVAHSMEFDAHSQQIHPVGSSRRQCATIWEILARQGFNSIVFGWPATQGGKPELARMVSDRFADPTAPPGVHPWPPAVAGTYWPEEIRQRLDPLRLSPESVGTDIVSRYIPQWRKIDQKRDQRLSLLRIAMARELSQCAGISELLAKEPWDFAAVRLSGSHRIAQLFIKFHPPQRPGVNPREFELYQNVLRVAGQSLDHTLNIFKNICGPKTTIMIVSAAGLGLPSQGMLAAAGRNLASDTLLHSAHVLDVAPTILHWFGLPVGEDMEGRILTESFVDQKETGSIPTWENMVGTPKTIPSGEAIPHPQNDRLHQETLWNLAQSCLEAEEWDAAATHLEQLVRAFPERPDYSQALFHCWINLGRVAEAEGLLELVLEGFPPGPLAFLPRAELALAKGDLRHARQLADNFQRTQPEDPIQQHRLGVLLLRLREWDSLANLARFALTRRQDDPLAWLGLAEALLRKKEPTEAAKAAQRAIQLKYSMGEAHFVLARALLAQSQWSQAAEAMNALLKLQPDNKIATDYNRRIKMRQPAAGN